MASYTENFSEVNAFLGYIYGVANATEANTGYVSLANYHRAVVIIHPVSLGSALDVDIEQATSAAGAGAKTFDAGGHDITVAAADTMPSVIEIQTEELDVTGGFYFINVEVTATVASYYVCEVWGTVPRYPPVPTTTLDSITN